MALAFGDATPRVTSISPVAGSIPANILRLYITYNRPARGVVTTQDVRLLDSAGRTISAAFMDFGRDLWSPDGRRLTVLFDPGRIKRGVEGTGESATPLQVGHSFTVAVSGKRFQYLVTPAVRTAISQKNWRLVNPEAGSRKPYTITFDREMDGALLQDQLNVVDSQGRNLPGQVTVSASGKVWSWRPEKNWQTGSYQLVAGSSLEDVSGNRVGEALDHDAGSPDAPQKNLIIPFTIQKPIVHFRIMRFSLGRLRENNQ